MSLSTIFNYDIQKLARDLAKVFRIQDWDIYIKLVTGADMVKEGYSIDTKGLCTKDLLHREAMIFLNHEHDDMEMTFEYERNIGWMTTLVHELIHLVVEPIACQQDLVLDILKMDKELKTELDAYNTKAEETIVNQFSKIVFNLVSQEDLGKLLEKYKLNKLGTDFEKELDALMAKYNVNKEILCTRGEDNAAGQDAK